MGLDALTAALWTDPAWDYFREAHAAGNRLRDGAGNSFLRPYRLGDFHRKLELHKNF